MTSPDPVAPDEAPATRATPRSAARRMVDAATGERTRRASRAPAAGEVAVTREPRPNGSRAASVSSGRKRSDDGTGAAAAREHRPSDRADDVLDRLARLGEPEPATVDAEAFAIPVIVEADPTYPPVASVTVPDVVRDPSTAAVLGAGATIPATLDASTRVDTPVEQVAAGATTAAAGGSSVSSDLPTALVGVPDGDDPSALTTADPVEVPDVVPQFVPAPTPIPIPVPVPVPVPVLTAVPGADPSAHTGGHAPAGVAVDESTGMTLPVRRLRPPLVFRRAKPRVRRVTRVVRHVDTWSVFKVALVFNAILYLVCLTAGVLLWNVAHATGTIDNVERFFEQFGWETFEFQGGEIYHNAWTGGLFVVVGLTGFAVLLATLFNLITDLVGGIRVSVLEEEVIATPRRPGDPTGSTTSTGIPRP